VVAIQENGSFNANPSAESMLTEGCELVMIGSTEQRQRFLALRP
jgi:K+/H+ antiporter YhaU regulatory subunit KhtT